MGEEAFVPEETAPREVISSHHQSTFYTTEDEEEEKGSLYEALQDDEEVEHTQSVNEVLAGHAQEQLSYSEQEIPEPPEDAESSSSSIWMWILPLLIVGLLGLLIYQVAFKDSGGSSRLENRLNRNNVNVEGSNKNAATSKKSR